MAICRISKKLLHIVHCGENSKNITMNNLIQKNFQLCLETIHLRTRSRNACILGIVPKLELLKIKFEDQRLNKFAVHDTPNVSHVCNFQSPILCENTTFFGCDSSFFLSLFCIFLPIFSIRRQRRNFEEHHRLVRFDALLIIFATVFTTNSFIVEKCRSFSAYSRVLEFSQTLKT